jgi:hypothetical protein
MPPPNKKTAPAAKSQNKKREIDTIDAAPPPAIVAKHPYKNTCGLGIYFLLRQNTPGLCPGDVWQGNKMISMIPFTGAGLSRDANSKIIFAPARLRSGYFYCHYPIFSKSFWESRICE